MAQLAVQLYTLRNYKTLEDRLKAVAEAGYAGVETLGTHDLAASELKALLDTYGLVSCSSHTGLKDLQADLDHHISFNQVIGNHTLVIPYLQVDERPETADAWHTLGAMLGELGKRCQSAGMTLLYHNHDFEMAVYDGKTGLDWLIEGADGELGVELDLAWIVKGRQDPIDFLKRYSGRCPRVHVKDIAPDGENLDEAGWADVGFGTLNWAKLLPEILAAGAEWLVVEHDLPKDPLSTISRSHQTLRKLL